MTAMLAILVIGQKHVLKIPALAKCRLANSLKIKEGKDTWTISCYRCEDADIEHFVADNFAIIRKNNVE